MFRLIRLLMFTAIAFLVGLFYERSQQMERCKLAGGKLVQGICKGVPNDG